MRRILATTLTGLAALAVGVGGAGPAQAGTGPAAASARAGDVTVRAADPVCLQARAVTGTAGRCAAEVRVHTDAARPITAAELAEYGDLVAANGMTVAQAAAVSTVYIRGWYQEQHGLYYVNWKERHEGKFLYNGSIAWVNNAHGYVGGYHRCGLGYGIGYSVEVTYCKAYGQSTYTVDNYDAYKVHVVAKGIPIYVTHSMHAYTRGNGSVG